MFFDEESLESYREIIDLHLPSLASIYRYVRVNEPNGSQVASDGMGGFIYSQVKIESSADERTLIFSNIPCRVTVPKANRSDSEYETNSAKITESRAVIVFKHNQDILESDRVDVILDGKTRSFEVQVIADHSDSYSLQVNCVELKVERV